MKGQAHRILPLAATVLLLAFFSASAGFAAPMFGVRAGINSDPEGPLVGGELLAPLGSAWWVNPNVEYVPGDGADLVGVSADFHYDLPVDHPALLWLGLGPSLLFRNYDNPRVNDKNNLGANLLMGFGWRTQTGVVPYLQGKLVLSDNTFGSLGVGVRF